MAAATWKANGLAASWAGAHLGHWGIPQDLGLAALCAAHAVRALRLPIRLALPRGVLQLANGRRARMQAPCGECGWGTEASCSALQAASCQEGRGAWQICGWEAAEWRAPRQQLPDLSPGLHLLACKSNTAAVHCLHRWVSYLSPGQPVEHSVAHACFCLQLAPALSCATGRQP